MSKKQIVDVILKERKVLQQSELALLILSKQLASVNDEINTMQLKKMENDEGIKDKRKTLRNLKQFAITRSIEEIEAEVEEKKKIVFSKEQHKEKLEGRAQIQENEKEEMKIMLEKHREMLKEQKLMERIKQV